MEAEQIDVVKRLREHLVERMAELKTEIATERLAGNTYKEGRAKAARAELLGVELILIKGDYLCPE